MSDAVAFGRWAAHYVPPLPNLPRVSGPEEIAVRSSRVRLSRQAKQGVRTVHHGARKLPASALAPAPRTPGVKPPDDCLKVRRPNRVRESAKSTKPSRLSRRALGRSDTAKPEASRTN
jgi:hypothetical protein